MSTNVRAVCPYCQSPISQGDRAVVCSHCGIPHHDDCWVENGGCTTYGCGGISANASLITAAPAEDAGVESGRMCPYCQSPIYAADRIVVCSRCGMPHHSDCWAENGRCTTYGCADTAANPSTVSATEPVSRSVTTSQPLEVTSREAHPATRNIGVLPWLSRKLGDLGAVIGLIVGLVGGGLSGGIGGAVVGAFAGLCIGPLVGILAPYILLLCLCMLPFVSQFEGEGGDQQILLGLIIFAVLAGAGHIPLIPTQGDSGT